MGLNEEIMDREIEVRMRSEVWDRGVARGVFRRRRLKRYVAMASGAAASMAAAAVLFIAILPGIRGGYVEGEALNGFVNAQVEGTWKSVFDAELQNGGESLVSDARYDDSLDVFIADTLELRL